MEKSQLELAAFFVLFAVVALMLCAMFLPFLQTLALAAVLAILFHKPFLALTRAFGGEESLAAVVVVLGVLLFCVIPLFFISARMVQEAQNIYLAVQNSNSGFAQTLRAAIEGPVRHLYPGFSFDLSAYAVQALAFLSHNLASVISQTLYLFLETALMLLAFFFFLRDGKQILEAFGDLSPFRREHTDKILKNLAQTINAVLRGTLLVALIRLVCFLLAFSLFGIPNAVLWGSVGGVIGAIPGLGTLFVVVPVAGYLYVQGHSIAALLFSMLGFVIMVGIDNMLATYFFGKGLEVPPIFVICSLLGGIFLFGPLGFILGPLVLSLFLSTLHMYRILVLKQVG